MKKYMSIFICILLLFSFSSCKNSDNSETVSDSSDIGYYIMVNDETLSKNYIGYFFYIAQETMLSEAGWNDDNSTPGDIKTYWETTEIDGINAVEAARDAAAKNAVEQKVKYFKSISEGVSLSDEDLVQIEDYISLTISENGGEEAFAEKLKKTGTDIETYRQITIENEYINRLFQKYIDEGILQISDDEYATFYEENAHKYNDEEMLGAAYTNKFNTMTKEWEKEFSISINDAGMKEFQIVYE